MTFTHIPMPFDGYVRASSEGKMTMHWARKGTFVAIELIEQEQETATLQVAKEQDDAT